MSKQNCIEWVRGSDKGEGKESEQEERTGVSGRRGGQLLPVVRACIEIPDH